MQEDGRRERAALVRGDGRPSRPSGDDVLPEQGEEPPGLDGHPLPAARALVQRVEGAHAVDPVAACTVTPSRPARLMLRTTCDRLNPRCTAVGALAEVERAAPPACRAASPAPRRSSGGPSGALRQPGRARDRKPRRACRGVGQRGQLVRVGQGDPHPAAGQAACDRTARPPSRRPGAARQARRPYVVASTRVQAGSWKGFAEALRSTNACQRGSSIAMALEPGVAHAHGYTPSPRSRRRPSTKASSGQLAEPRHGVVARENRRLPGTAERPRVLAPAQPSAGELAQRGRRVGAQPQPADAVPRRDGGRRLAAHLTPEQVGEVHAGAPRRGCAIPRGAG